jgi:methionine-rich copper-binding protein CopC
VVVALLLGTVVTVPAAAHNRLVGSDPADGSTVARTPGAVVLTLDEPAVALGTQVVVTGPDGPASTGAAELLDATVRQPLVPGAPAGSYTVAWRITSADGHPITGQLGFAAAAAGAGEYTGPAAPPAAVDTGGAPVWGWGLLAVLLLAAAGVLAVLRRRSRGPQD